ncbi:MAG: hypothetical protein V7700_12950 [Halioglobus sp.]
MSNTRRERSPGSEAHQPGTLLRPCDQPGFPALELLRHSTVLGIGSA